MAQPQPTRNREEPRDQGSGRGCCLVFILLILESSQVPEAQVAESNEKDTDQTSGTRLGVSWLTKPPPRGGSEWGCDQVETVAALA